jgi:hypothetical protein
VNIFAAGNYIVDLCVVSYQPELLQLIYSRTSTSTSNYDFVWADISIIFGLNALFDIFHVITGVD